MSSSSKKGRIFIFSGPSGAGKSTVLAEVFKRLDDPFFSVSATTRAPRPGEKDGVNYYFIARDKFLNMISENQFLEYAEYVGNYYGTPLKPIFDRIDIGKDVFLDVEVQGFLQIVKKIPDAVSIFIAPPDLKAVEDRLRKRGTETEEKIKSRLETAKRELALSDKYDYVVVNDMVQHAADEILSIIKI